MSRGIRLAIQFSNETNRKQLCGRPEAQQVFREYLRTGKNEEAVRKQFNQFEGLHAYLQTIGEATNNDWLSYEVVEAYWIGNNLLEELTLQDLETIIKRLHKRGFPKQFMNDRLHTLAPGLVAHHDFNVLYMGVGLTSGNVEPTRYNMEMCRVNQGKIVDIRGGNLIVQTNKLVFEEQQLSLEEDTRTIVYNQEFIQPRIGDYVAIHWGTAPTTLTKKQVTSLEHYTEQIRNTLNDIGDWMLTPNY